MGWTPVKIDACFELGLNPKNGQVKDKHSSDLLKVFGKKIQGD